MSDNKEIRWAVLSLDYPQYERPSATSYADFWTGTDEERTFAIVPLGDHDWTDDYTSEPSGYGYVTLAVPETDPRHEGLNRYANVPEGHRGWNVERRHLTFVPNPFEAAPEGSEDAAPEDVLPSVEDVMAPIIAAAVEAERVRVTEELTSQFESWKEHAADVAIDYANRNDLCSVFDDTMEEIGLRSRRDPYTITLTFDVTGRDEDNARARVGEIIDGTPGYRLANPDTYGDVEHVRVEVA